MCFAIPGKVIAIEDDNEHAQIDYGDGTKRKAYISLVDVKKGDYVLVHAGFAIQVVDEQEAKETLSLFREMLSSQEET